MRTLKIFVIAASLFLFAISACNKIKINDPMAIKTYYPPEIPDIQNAPIQFVCETPSSVFLKAYLNPEKEWQVFIAGRNQKEMRIKLIFEGRISNFAFFPSANEWKNIHNLTKKDEKEEVEKYIGGDSTETDDVIIWSCIRFNLRLRGISE